MTIKEVAIDVETTFSNKGNPYDTTNTLVCYSYANVRRSGAVREVAVERDDFCREVASSKLLVLFNAKFDLAWLRKQGIDFTGKDIWDCQLAEFILGRQQNRYPSLEDAAIKYGLGNKIDVIKNEYWDKGIDTDEIPWEVLAPYAEQDAVLTLGVYHQQLEQFKKNPLQYKLFRLQCKDLLLLLDMEWNGLKYDAEIAKTEGDKLKLELEKIQEKLSGLYRDVVINFGSGDQLSAFLYGGTISTISKRHDGFFKTGKRAGEPKYVNEETLHQLPRLFEPVKGSELKKEGVYGTAEDILKKLHGPKKIMWVIESLLEFARIKKLLSTYYEGLSKLNTEKNWKPGYLHGQYNQCVARTGRLSSSSPNMQNLSGESLMMFITRYS